MKHERGKMYTIKTKQEYQTLGSDIWPKQIRYTKVLTYVAIYAPTIVMILKSRRL